MSTRRGIDIIVPVYNALEDLKLCVESIRRHTDLDLDRVVFIDDKSPDENIEPYLKSIQQPGFVLLRNEENQGFSGTINRGLCYSDRDVILLNTDTIVTQGWIDKIVACAYSDPAIGTVTPFSNNATLCSIPNFCQENTVPYGLSIDEYAGIIQCCSLKEYPRITVAVGFCMFIKREVIDLVGLFDQETFRRGYGEENDFCWRAEQLGYYHVLCDDTYIYHSGSASFLSDEKKQLIAEHERIIDRRYPDQNHENAEYVRDNPHQFLRTNVDIHAKLHNGKRNVLYVLHLDFQSDAGNSVGGTQLHVRDLMNRLRRDNNVFVLARDGEFLRLTAYLEQEQLVFRFPIGKAKLFQPFCNEAIRRAFREILAAFSVDLVHVHHITGLSFDLFDTAKELGIPLVLSIHDFYYVCPTIKLMEKGKRYCSGFGENCADCLRDQLGYTDQVAFLDVWREKCRQVLERCDALIAPSNAVKEIYTAVYPGVGERICVIPHGMDPFEEKETEFQNGSSAGFCCNVEYAFNGNYVISGWALQEGCASSESEVFVYLEDVNGKRGEYLALRENRPDVVQVREDDRYMSSGFSVQIPDCCFATGPMKLQLALENRGTRYFSDVIMAEGYVQRKKERRRIAFLGGLNEFKGSKTACQMMLNSGNHYDWYVIGGIGDPELAALDRNNVYKLGWYRRENVGAILQQNQIDLVCILSTCPETFCYTMSEAELAGVPVLASEIGALGERVKREQTGWLIPAGASGKEVLQKIGEIFADGGDWSRVQQRTAQFHHRTIAEMCEDYVRVYRELPAAAGGERSFDARGIYQAFVRGQSGTAAAGNDYDMDLLRRVNELEATLQNIDQSLEYRMVKFLNRENFPLRRPFRWLVRVAYKFYKRFKR